MTQNTFFENDAHAQQLGIQLIEESPGFAKTQITINASHLNGLGTGHGAVIFALADCALAVAANNTEDAMGVGLQVNAAYISMVKCGDILTATTHQVALKNKIGNFTADVTNQNDELIASFQCMVYRKKK